MAFTYGFYNYDENDSGDSKLYDAKQMSQLFDGIITDGVYAHVGSKFMVTAVSNVVRVGTGRAWFNHTWNYNDSVMALTTPAAPTAGSRIDAVMLVIDSRRGARTNEIRWKLGSQASSPSRPTMIHDTDYNEYALAYVTRTANSSTISDTQITNVVGTSETPYVTGVLETIDASQILANFERSFAHFKEDKNTEFQSFLASEQTEFDIYLSTLSGEVSNVIDDELRPQFSGFITQSDERFHSFLSACQTQYDAFEAILQAQCDDMIKVYALQAEGHATGTQNGNNVSPSSPYYNNNSKYYAEQAADIAGGIEIFSKNPPYIGPNGNWYVWSAEQKKYVDSGVDASITVDIADVTMLPYGSTPTVRNSGTSTDPVFHLSIPMAKDAYRAAKDGGYTGTEAEFNAYLVNLESYAQSASNSASNAATSASTASTKASEAATSESNAAASATLAESYAKGGTNTRTGEDTDNAKYYKDEAKRYYENAEAVVGIGIATPTRAGIVKPDGETLIVDENGKMSFNGISDDEWAELEELFE